jgi:hypothetical protein
MSHPAPRRSAVWIEFTAEGTAEPQTLRWQDGQVTGTPFALELFHEAVQIGEPVRYLEPDVFDPGAENPIQFMATAQSLYLPWGAATMSNDAAKVIDSYREPMPDVDY